MYYNIEMFVMFNGDLHLFTAVVQIINNKTEEKLSPILNIFWNIVCLIDSLQVSLAKRLKDKLYKTVSEHVKTLINNEGHH